MMNIPNKVKIGWRNYKIVQGEHRSTTNGENLYGEIDYAKHEIYLWENQDEEEKQSSLLHEIVHGIFYQAGHSEWRNNEDLVGCIADGLMQVIKDNPDMFIPAP